MVSVHVAAVSQRCWDSGLSACWVLLRSFARKHLFSFARWWMCACLQYVRRGVGGGAGLGMECIRRGLRRCSFCTPCVVHVAVQLLPSVKSLLQLRLWTSSFNTRSPHPCMAPPSWYYNSSTRFSGGGAANAAHHLLLLGAALSACFAVCHWCMYHSLYRNVGL
jgi:hypothetical protein